MYGHVVKNATCANLFSLYFNFSVSQDTLHTWKFQQRPDPGVGEPGEGAGESTLLHDDHGGPFK